MPESYFETVKYRVPQHPVIEAYVRPKLQYICETVPLNRNTTVLDIGCGNGVYSYYFAQLCGRVTGIDTSQNMPAYNPCANVVQGDASALPFQSNSFDVAFEGNLLHHVNDRAKVVEEMARVSRRWVILIEPSRYNPLMLASSYTIGGIFEVVAHGLPPGLGSHITWDSRLDGKLAQAIVSHFASQEG